MTTKRRHVREGDRLDDDATIVIRGGALDPPTLRADALRYHDIYGEFGISVFATRDAPSTNSPKPHRSSGSRP